MKILNRAAVIFWTLIIVSGAGYSPAIAQTTASSSTNDGSTEPTPVRRERLRGYRQQSSELQQKINALPGTAEPAVRMPVLFGVGLKDIFPNFGDPRDGGARTHEGEDIMAVKGTPIVSPTAAVVLRTVTGASEGITVYTANPGGETFVYMHLDRFGEGVTSGVVLAPGSLIGYVGNTGNASGGAAHLHFEIHDSSGTPLNPFPRLSSEFTAQEKISYLSTVLGQTADSVALSRFLVSNFRGTFVADLAAGITLPLSITDALAAIPAAPAPAGTSSLPAGDLDLGSSGTAVVTLQRYLIQTASGAAAGRLATAGATGYFGSITKAALLEYQVKVGISPASGYYGVTTREFIAAHPLSGTPQPTVPTPTPNGSFPVSNLTIGARSIEVVWLQTFLIKTQTGPAAIALTAAGATGYFGTITKNALAEYQSKVGISPASGYYGPITRSYLSTLTF